MHRPALCPVTFLIVLGCAAVFPGPGARAQTAEPAVRPQGSRPAVAGRALLVGVTEYPRLREELGEEKYRQERIELAGPANDVRLFREVLGDVLGMKSDVAELVGWDAKDETRRPTRVNILAALDRLAAEARAGELVVVYLAGHGCQQPDRAPLSDADPLRFDGEPDGCDELFLPADTGGWRTSRARVENAIADDELAPRIAAIAAKGARVWLLLDSCHSGTMLRGVTGDVVERQILQETLGVPMVTAPVAPPQAPGGELELPARGVVAMYAAGPHESAIEKLVNWGGNHAGPNSENRYYGVFTWLLAKTLRRHGAGITFAELQSSLAIAYAAHGIRSVSPMAQGDLGSRLLDGAPVGPQLFVSERDGGIELSAGLLHDLRPGARLAVFEPGRRGDEQALLGHIEVASVELATSRCVRSQEGSRVPPLSGDRLTCPAEVVSCPLERQRIQLAVVDEQEQGVAIDVLPASLRRALADPDLQQLELTDKTSATWLLQVVGDGVRLWKGSAGKGGAAKAIATADLPQRIENAWRVQNLCRVVSQPGVSGLPKGLRAELQAKAADGGWRPVQTAERLRPGTEVRFVVQNGTGRDLDLWAFYLSADDSMTCLFPNPRRAISQSVGRDEKREIVSFESSLDDTTLGIESVLVLALPFNGPNLDWVTGRGRTRGQQDRGPIADVMELLSSGTARGLGESIDAAAGMAAQLQTLHVTWGTVAPRIEDGPAPPPRVRGLDGLRRPLPRGPESRTRGGEPEVPSDLTDVYGKCAPAVFAVRTRTGHGTGFLIDAKGLVLTNHHVVAGGPYYASTGQRAVQLIRGTLDRDGMMRREQAEVLAAVVWSDPERDLALLRIVGTPAWLAGLEPIPMRETAPRPGEECLILGHPSSGMLWTVRGGRVGSLGRGPHDMVNEVMAQRHGMLPESDLAKMKDELARQRGVEILLSDCAANPGDSGGPLLDGKGQLIGVTFAIPKEVRDDKFTYHVHPIEVRAFLVEARAREASEPADKVHVPLPAELGANVFIRQSGAVDKDHDGELWNVVVGTEGGRTWILIDVDGDSTFKPGDPNDGGPILAALQAGTFDAELAFYFAPDEQRACYDRDNDGKIDLVLVNIDSDREADVRFSVKDGTWRVELDVSEELVRMESLEAMDARMRARAAKILRRVTKE